MSNEQIISWLEGLIQAKDRIGQGISFDYLFGYVDSAKALVDELKKKSSK